MAVITISRQFGAGGRTLGGMVSKRLAYSLVEDDIIQMIATKANVSPSWVESIEKEAGGLLLKFISGIVSKSFIDKILDDERGYIDEEIYVDTLHKVISQIADEGNAVILGRGGQYVLRKHLDAFHVLLVADMDDRIKFMEQHYKLSREQAILSINKQEKKRVNLYKKFGKDNYESPELYHIVINTSRVTLEDSAMLVENLVKS
ncbi:MAG: cytidylate kinase-like family protein [Desulfobacterales bacterium]|nr:cytidylate kinase-like family protein [Desulfobacterales bacterium]